MAFPPYWVWITDVSTMIRADGCSGPATNAFLLECREHDIQYRFARDARQAYTIAARADREHYGLTYVQALMFARLIDREEADRDMKCGIQARSVFGKWSPLGWTRYLVLAKMKRGQRAWDKHREHDLVICQNCAARPRRSDSVYCSRSCQESWHQARLWYEGALEPVL
jgi:hypothetical protein